MRACLHVDDVEGRRVPGVVDGRALLQNADGVVAGRSCEEAGGGAPGDGVDGLRGEGLKIEAKILVVLFNPLKLQLTYNRLKWY